MSYAIENGFSNTNSAVGVLFLFSIVRHAMLLTQILASTGSCRKDCFLIPRYCTYDVITISSRLFHDRSSVVFSLLTRSLIRSLFPPRLCFACGFEHFSLPLNESSEILHHHALRSFSRLPRYLSTQCASYPLDISVCRSSSSFAGLASSDSVCFLRAFDTHGQSWPYHLACSVYAAEYHWFLSYDLTHPLP